MRWAKKYQNFMIDDWTKYDLLNLSWSFLSVTEERMYIRKQTGQRMENVFQSHS